MSNRQRRVWQERRQWHDHEDVLEIRRQQNDHGKKEGHPGHSRLCGIPGPGSSQERDAASDLGTEAGRDQEAEDDPGLLPDANRRQSSVPGPGHWSQVDGVLVRKLPGPPLA